MAHRLRRAPQGPQEAQHPAPLPRGQERRAPLREASTRTRAAFTTACIDLGAHPEYTWARATSSWARRRQSLDTAKVLGSMFDAIEFRGFKLGPRRTARRVFRRPCVERPHRPRAPHPDAGRLHDHQGALRQARGPHARLLRPGSQQRPELPHDHLRHSGRELRQRHTQGSSSPTPRSSPSRRSSPPSPAPPSASPTTL